MAERFNHIRHVVAVMSGKGSVGKMFFSSPRHPRGGPIGLLPVQTWEGIEVMSINLLLPSEDEAVIWRGPLISNAIKQFWGDVLKSLTGNGARRVRGLGSKTPDPIPKFSRSQWCATGRTSRSSRR